MAEYIEKEALKRAVRKAFHDLRMRIDINSIINIQPKADVVEVKHGEWMYLYEDNYKCSICGSWWCCTDSQIDEMNYCPNCGSRMEEVEDDKGND